MKSLITLMGALVIAGAAQAAQPQPTQAPAAVTANDAAAVAQDEARNADMDDRTCLHYTGTRIASRSDARGGGNARSADKKRRPCSNGTIGRAYTRDDIDKTGEIDLADALRKLDPSIH